LPDCVARSEPRQRCQNDRKPASRAGQPVPSLRPRLAVRVARPTRGRPRHEDSGTRNTDRTATSPRGGDGNHSRRSRCGALDPRPHARGRRVLPNGLGHRDESSGCTSVLGYTSRMVTSSYRARRSSGKRSARTFRRPSCSLRSAQVSARIRTRRTPSALAGRSGSPAHPLTSAASAGGPRDNTVCPPVCPLGRGCSRKPPHRPALCQQKTARQPRELPSGSCYFHALTRLRSQVRSLLRPPNQLLSATAFDSDVVCVPGSVPARFRTAGASGSRD
jgi:hypothetical protein